MDSRCLGGYVMVEIDFEVTEMPAEEIVGWRIERAVMGQCDAESVYV